MPRVFEHPEQLLACVGETLGESEWLRVEQSRIDRFAEATGDHQWIHVNLFLPQIVEVRGIAMGVNYGCDRVRFPNVVKAGARVRGRAELVAAEAVKGAVQATIRVSVEIDGEDRPGCVVDTISRYYPA